MKGTLRWVTTKNHIGVLDTYSKYKKSVNKFKNERLYKYTAKSYTSL